MRKEYVMLNNCLTADLDSHAPVYHVIDHTSFKSFIDGLKTCSVLFVPRHPEAVLNYTSLFTHQAEIHRFNQQVIISLKSITELDLYLLQSVCGSVLVRHLTSNFIVGGAGKPLLQQLAAFGFRVFFEHASPEAQSAPLRSYCLIGFAEFAISSPDRLARYPIVTQGMSYGMERHYEGKPLRTVFILDLIQDFEVLQPLILRCLGAYRWRDFIVSVSDRVLKSHLWVYIKPFLEVLGIVWIKSVTPLDAVGALGSGRSVLITASESTAGGHIFSHTVCRLAPRETIKITLQHGYECVGLRHHQAHDVQFPNGVRFASDYVLTWSDQDQLGDIHPADRNKLIPVGVIKSFAEDVSIAQYYENRVVPVIPKYERPIVNLLVAENLHSVRFTNPQRYQLFLNFINQANKDIGYNLTVRSHPGKRTLENNKTQNNFRFLEGVLKAVDLVGYDYFVSPPSTIVLDAVLAGVPALIWTDRKQLGDCENYDAISTVCRIEDLEILCQDQNNKESIRLNNYQWAARNVCAFNGIPQAWSKMNEIVGI